MKFTQSMKFRHGRAVRRPFLAGLAASLTALAACASGPAVSQEAVSQETPPATRAVVAGAAGPVRNETPRAGEEIVTIRYWKIRKGTFPEFLKASQDGVWPYFEKIGARVVGMWRAVPGPGETAPADYDEVYLMTRYASLEHWAATRNAAAMGGDGPDFQALQDALAVRRALTLETRLTFVQGFTGPVGPVYMPGTGERFAPVDAPQP
ncbi:MAG: NIPSNAP family protein [Hyphomonadaceae bacterium]